MELSGASSAETETSRVLPQADKRGTGKADSGASQPAEDSITHGYSVVRKLKELLASLESGNSILTGEKAIELIGRLRALSPGLENRIDEERERELQMSKLKKENDALKHRLELSAGVEEELSRIKRSKKMLELELEESKLDVEILRKEALLTRHNGVLSTPRARSRNDPQLQQIQRELDYLKEQRATLHTQISEFAGTRQLRKAKSEGRALVRSAESLEVPEDEEEDEEEDKHNAPKSLLSSFSLPRTGSLDSLFARDWSPFSATGESELVDSGRRSSHRQLISPRLLPSFISSKKDKKPTATTSQSRTENQETDDGKDKAAVFTTTNTDRSEDDRSFLDEAESHSTSSGESSSSLATTATISVVGASHHRYLSGSGSVRVQNDANADSEDKESSKFRVNNLTRTPSSSITNLKEAFINDASSSLDDAVNDSSSAPPVSSRRAHSRAKRKRPSKSSRKDSQKAAKTTPRDDSMLGDSRSHLDSSEGYGSDPEYHSRRRSISDAEKEVVILTQVDKKHFKTLGASRTTGSGKSSKSSLKSTKGLFRSGSRKRRSKRTSRKSLKREEKFKLHNTGSSSTEEELMGALSKEAPKETQKETPTAPSLRKSGQHKRVSIDVGDDGGETTSHVKETRGKHPSGTFTGIFREKDKDKEKEREKEKDLTPSKRHRKHSKTSQRRSLTAEDELRSTVHKKEKDEGH